MSKMARAKIFSTLDASAGYWQIQVDDESSELLVFNTPFGRFKFDRLHFGISCASEAFSQRISQIIEGLDGVSGWGRSKAEHDKNLEQVLAHIGKFGLKLNKTKCKFGLNEVKYVGHIFSSEGVRPDPSKIKAIVDMPMPENASDVHRFLGMVTYLGKLLPNLSDKTACLRKLIEKDAVWDWTEEHTKQFRELQNLVTSSPVLQYYDPNLLIKLSVDASKAGMGAVLLQLRKEGWHLVAYASRSLNSSEKRYAQIEKETLAILFGAERLNHYVYGTQFSVESDHKPLQAIFKKSIDNAIPRIQRMLLRLQNYDFDLNFVPGKSIRVPDALSRAFLNATDTNEQKFEYQVHMVLDNLPVSKEKLNEIKQVTRNDYVLQKLSSTIVEGWPETKQTLPPELHAYFQYRNEITSAEGLLLKGDRVIIPTALRKVMKEKLHHGHIGIQRTRASACQVMFWPGLNAEITDMISKCSACIENQAY